MQPIMQREGEQWRRERGIKSVEDFLQIEAEMAQLGDPIGNISIDLLYLVEAP